MTTSTKTIADGAGTAIEDLIFPTEKGSLVFNVPAGAMTVQVTCDPENDVKSNPVAATWALLATLGAAATPDFVSFSKVTAIRGLPVGGIGELRVVW